MKRNLTSTLALTLSIAVLAALLLLLDTTRADTIAGLILINELDAQTPSTDVEEFVELYDGGAGNTSLDGLVLVFFNGSSDTSYRVVDLGGHSTGPGGYFVAGNAAVPNVDLVFPNSALQNGPDAVAVYSATVDDFPDGTPVTSTNLVDAIVYDDYNDDDPELRAALLNPGQPTALEGATSTEASAYSAQRCPDGSGGPFNTGTYAAHAPTPGAANECLARPVVLDVYPNDGDSGVSVDATVRATFNTTLTNVSTATFLLHGPSGPVPSTVSYSASSQRATLRPLESLASGTRYTATLRAELMDTGSALLGEDYAWSFTTGGGFDVFLPLVLRRSK